MSNMPIDKWQFNSETTTNAMLTWYIVFIKQAWSHSICSCETPIFGVSGLSTFSRLCGIIVNSVGVLMYPHFCWQTALYCYKIWLLGIVGYVYPASVARCPSLLPMPAPLQKVPGSTTWQLEGDTSRLGQRRWRWNLRRLRFSRSLKWEHWSWNYDVALELVMSKFMISCASSCWRFMCFSLTQQKRHTKRQELAQQFPLDAAAANLKSSQPSTWTPRNITADCCCSSFSAHTINSPARGPQAHTSTIMLNHVPSPHAVALAFAFWTVSLSGFKSASPTWDCS